MGLIKDLVDQNSNKISHVDDIKSKLNESIKKGRFTEDLFNEVQNLIGQKRSSVGNLADNLSRVSFDSAPI